MTIGNVNEDGNKFCGPAVVSIIAGIGTIEAAKLFAKRRRNNPRPESITYVYVNEIVDVLSELGFKVERVTSGPSIGSSLFFVLCTLNEAGVYVFNVPRHVIVIEITKDGKRYFCDNHTKKPMNASSSARLSQRVLQMIKVTKNEKETV